MPKLAIVGSGPAGYYTAEAAGKQWGEGAQVDIFDALPVPYGLVRSGVAPDHQSIKGVARRYEATALSGSVRFLGNVRVGQQIAIEELLGLYDAVVLATGAPNDRRLGLPGEDLGNVFGSAAFVGWYNGHPAHAALAPDLSGETAVVIGNGNVALDVARILAKSPGEFSGSDIVRHALDRLAEARIRRIVIVGRRGPHQIGMTPKELGELAHLERAAPLVDVADLPPLADDAALEPGQRKSVALLRGFAAASPPSAPRRGKPIEIAFEFFAAPRELLGEGKVTGVAVERTRIENGAAVGTGAVRIIPASLVVACIGFQTSPIIGVPYDTRRGRFANDGSRIGPGLYCVGWARRGPSGTIGTNRPDGFAVIETIAADLAGGGNPAKLGGAGFDQLARDRGIDVVGFADWRRIDAAEVADARAGAPREKFVAVDHMLAAARRD